MPEKIVWIDTETTGLDAKVNGIHQIGMLVEIGGNLVFQKEYRMQPFPDDVVEPKALKVSGTTEEDLLSYQDPHLAVKNILADLSHFINKFDKADKAFFGAYNSNFDMSFIFEFFKKGGEKYLGSFLNWKCVDPRYLVSFAEYEGIIPKLRNNKLGTVCEYFNIIFDAHTALDDILATRELYYTVSRLIKDHYAKRT